MPEEYKQQDKEATAQRLVAETASLENPVGHALTSAPAATGYTSTIELEEKRSVVDLRGGQAVTGWRAILVALALMFASVLLEVQGMAAAANFSQSDKAGMFIAMLLPALIGLVFLASGIKSLQNRQKLKSLRPGKELWEAEFGGNSRDFSTDSGRVARLYLRNFFLGQFFFIPLLYFGWSKVFSTAHPEPGMMMLLGVITLWYSAGTYMTYLKVKKDMDSQKLTMKLDSFPLFLGKEGKLTLANSSADSTMHLKEVALRCVQERVIVRNAKAPANRRTVAREGVQLYAEIRTYEFGAITSNRIPLAFAIPADPNLNTSLLTDDPIYWCLDVKGSSEGHQIETTFMLPVYKNE